MASKIINGSPNIAILETKIIADLCLGKFFIDLTPSIFKNATANQNVLGAKIKILNPYGFPIKEYAVTYDIATPIASTFSIDIPTQYGNFQWGTYIVSVEITDADGTKYEVIENTTICAIVPKVKKDKFGNLFGVIKGLCKVGKALIQVDEPPVYQGVASESKTQSYTLSFPTGTIAAPLVSTQPSFEVKLYEGIYKLQGEVCATYNYGGNNYVRVPYKVLVDKNILCYVNDCAVSERMLQIAKELKKDSCKDRQGLSDLQISIICELETIRLAIECGEDASDNIKHLHELVGLECFIGNVGTPVGAVGTPAESVSITGCNVTESINGLTRTYNIDNFEYKTIINPANNSFVVISDAVLGNCVKVQTLSFDISALYVEIKGQVTTQAEYNFWAGVVNNTIDDLPTNLLTCLSISETAWNALTFRERFLAVVSKMCACCGTSGQDCIAVIANLTQTPNGQFTVLNWLNNDVQYVDIYVDGILVDNILLSALAQSQTINGTIAAYTLTGYNDGQPHEVAVICYSAGKDICQGNTLGITINNAGCPSILPPSLSANSVPNASCPFNLNTLIQGAIPSGLTLQWHNANNTDPSSVVANPASVGSGTYFAFYANQDKCSSPSSTVTVVCQQQGICSEPLNMLVKAGAGNTANVTFSPAVSSPTSYLVKRKLFIDADIPANYTIIGTPTYNAGTNKYEIVDPVALPNTYYTYRGESQCSDGTKPATDFNYANIGCPVVSNIGSSNTIDFSFVGLGGQIDKYLVQLFDSTGNTLIQSVNILPAFNNPITGTFIGLTPQTNYLLTVTPFIGAVSKITCNQYQVTTLP